MKTIEIQVPEGKTVEWVDGVLTLVDERQPVTERVKTFKDACEDLGESHPLVIQYREVSDHLIARGMTDGKDDLIAYLKLRIIVAALNEGWEPKFEKGEHRNFPWFHFFTKEEYDKLDDEEKGRCVLRSGSNTSAGYGFVDVVAYNDASYSYTVLGSRLAFRTRELAKYAGEQFFEEWADFMFKPRTGEELNGKSEAQTDNSESDE